MKTLNQKMIFIACIFMVASSFAIASSRVAEITKTKEAPWPSPPVRVDLSPYGGGCIHLEFSPDSQFLCAWWLPSPPIGDYEKLAGKVIVFDLRGSCITEAVDQQGELVGKYISMFPETAWRRRFAAFVQDTNGCRVTMWAFTPDYSTGIRFLTPTNSPFEKGHEECWNFSNTNTPIWSTISPDKSEKTGKIGFFMAGGTNYVLLAFNGMKGFILSMQDGKIIDSFTYGKPESEAEALAYKRKFHLSGKDTENDPSWYFSASVFAFDPSSKLLACGDFFSRRIRVVSVEQPHKVVFEANTEDNPQRPRGGVWQVTSTFFGGNGKYLIVGYHFGGRLTSKLYDPIEIYETGTWQLVWSIDSLDVCSSEPPRISPDGKTMALTRGDWLEIGSFIPKPASGAH